MGFGKFLRNTHHQTKKINYKNKKKVMKVAHEAPMSIVKEIRNHTDYDYALPHLLYS